MVVVDAASAEDERALVEDAASKGEAERIAADVVGGDAVAADDRSCDRRLGADADAAGERYWPLVAGIFGGQFGAVAADDTVLDC